MSGGGGTSSSAPSSQTVTSTSIPEYARPYAESMLGQTSALTNINNNPYQPYQGQQVAGFSPMQVQGMTGIANQQVAPQLTDASNLAYQSGLGGLGAYQGSAGLQNAALDYGAAGAQGAFANADLSNAYGAAGYQSGQMGQQLGIEGGAKFGNMGAAAGQAGQNIGTAGGAYYGGQGMGYGAQGAGLAGRSIGTGQIGMASGLGYGQAAQNPYAVASYMNPYLQNTLAPSLQLLNQQYGMQGAQEQGAATSAGAFGGSREALMQGLNQQNRMLAGNQLVSNAYNQAYNTANTNMQQAAQLGMQGAGVGLSGLNAANQNYATGIAGANTGLQGVNTQLAGTAQGMQGAQVGLAGVDRQLAGTAQGMQGAQLGMQGANQAGQLMLGGANAGMQGVQGAVGAGQYGLSGLGLAGSAGSTLGALGQTQFGQQQAINQAQMQAGAQQQALQQQGLNVAYQQYQDQMNYPYKQLAFQSDMMRGLPLSQSAQTIYQNTGAMAPQLLGAGIAAYGATNKSAKEGGLMSYARGGAVQGYAMGGQPVVDPRAVAATSPAALPSKLSQLTDGQLQAYARTVKDAVALAEVKTEMTRRAGVRQPQGEEPTQTVAQEVAGQGGIAEQPVMAAAGGGIVALAGGSKDATEDDTFGTQVPVRDSKDEGPTVTSILGARVPTRNIIPAPKNDQTMANWDASGQEITRGAEVFAERQAMEQEQRAKEQAAAAQEAAQYGGRIDTETINQQAQQAQQAQQHRADTTAQMYAGNAQEGPGQYPNLGGITAVPAAGGATPVATGAPAGGGITSVAPNVGGAPRTGAIGNAPVDAIGKGAVPVGSPNDMSWGAFAANVKAASQLEPEDKALLADMQKRADRRLARAEGQEKNVLNEALISGGLAMMGGLNLSDGVKRMAEAGGKQYFASKAEASKAINAAEDAQDAFNQYQMSYKQGNKKMIGEMYGKWQSSMLDFQGKIQAAAMTSGASLENARATREATAEARRQSIEQHALDRDEKIRQFDLSLKQNENQFVTRMKELGNQQAITSFEQLDRTFKDTMAAKEAAQAKVYAEFKPRFERFTLMDPAKMSDADKKQYNALNTEYKAAMLSRLTPWDDQLEQVQNRKAAMMGIRPIGSAGGTNSQFKVVGVE
jgi:hypothetical protein